MVEAPMKCSSEGPTGWCQTSMKSEKKAAASSVFTRSSGRRTKPDACAASALNAATWAPRTLAVERTPGSICMGGSCLKGLLFATRILGRRGGACGQFFVAGKSGGDDHRLKGIEPLFVVVPGRVVDLVAPLPFA